MTHIGENTQPNLADKFFGGDAIMGNCLAVLALAKRRGILSLTDSEIAQRAIADQRCCCNPTPLRGSDIIETSQALRRMIKGGWVIHGERLRSYGLDPSVEVEMSKRLKQTGGHPVSFLDIAPDA